MTDWNPVTERERAGATLAECEARMRRAEEQARRAGEAMRRATRDVDAAREELATSRRWLERLAVAEKREWRRGLVINHAAGTASQWHHGSGSLPASAPEAAAQRL